MYKVDSSRCIGCHTCMGACPAMAIGTGADGKCVIDTNKCMSCGTCAAICPVSAIVPESK